VHAVERGNFGSMVALQGKSVRSVPLGDAVNDIKRVPVDGEVVRTARCVLLVFLGGPRLPPPPPPPVCSSSRRTESSRS
jgi:hypothetical protein